MPCVEKTHPIFKAEEMASDIAEVNHDLVQSDMAGIAYAKEYHNIGPNVNGDYS